ncbi:RNA methyltransferase [Vicingaceae bacterium]|nr:RNA methyltransferase [Vicingaceae bacterium]
MMSLTKREEKIIVSLHQKKFRNAEGLFIVEGVKMVEEAITSDFKVKYVVASIEFNSEQVELKHCDSRTMQRISAFKTAPGVMAVVEIPTESVRFDSPITLMAENVQDPGNLGTIIRTADALGVKSMVCSLDCVDHFSPKVVQATMGSIFRMNVVVQDLFQYVGELPSSTPIYAAHLKGENLYQTKITSPCVLVVGNESKGMSGELTAKVTQLLKIPMVGKAESLNVSIATAIILGEFSRQIG